MHNFNNFKPIPKFIFVILIKLVLYHVANTTIIQHICSIYPFSSFCLRKSDTKLTRLIYKWTMHCIAMSAGHLTDFGGILNILCTSVRCFLFIVSEFCSPFHNLPVLTLHLQMDRISSQYQFLVSANHLPCPPAKMYFPIFYF